MDKYFVYQEQLPLTDDLLTQNNLAVIALANLSADFLHGQLDPANFATSTRFSGFKPTYPGGFVVNFGPGRAYAAGVLDAVTYSDLGTDGRTFYMQGQQDTMPLTFGAAPATIGWSRIDIVQAQLKTVDDNLEVIEYYNSSNPAQPWSGPNNSGSSQPTQRRWALNFSVKAGTAGAAPVAPAADAGYTALFQFTILHATVNIDGSNYAVAPAAPFLAGLSQQHHTGAPGSAPKIDLNLETLGYFNRPIGIGNASPAAMLDIIDEDSQIFLGTAAGQGSLLGHTSGTNVAWGAWWDNAAGSYRALDTIAVRMAVGSDGHFAVTNAGTTVPLTPGNLFAFDPDIFNVTAAGTVNNPKGSFAYVYKNGADQAIAATTATVVVFDAVATDYQTEYNVGTNKFVAAVAGLYQISVNLEVTADAAAGVIVTELKVNGSIQTTLGDNQSSPTARVSTSGTFCVPMGIGDYFQVSIYSTTDCHVLGTNIGTTLQVLKVR